MARSLILAAAALMLSGAAAFAQTVYVAPGYAYPVPAYVAPSYVFPSYVAPGYPAPGPVYAAPGAPLYNYDPGYVGSYTVTTPAWDW